MGLEAFYGATTAFIVGGILYFGYGKNRINPLITPWETFGLQYTDPEEVETRRRLTAFYAADIDGNGELNLAQYFSAMEALGYSSDSQRELRAVFDEADTDGNGIIDMKEFVASVAKHESLD